MSNNLAPMVIDARLLGYFYHFWHWIERDRSNGHWRTETAYPLQFAVLCDKWNDPECIVGLRFGETTRYGMIDIDRGSSYHPAANPAALSQIRAALERIGICRSVLIQSSESGGLHLYVPFSEEVPTFDLARSLVYALTTQGMQIAAGQLEVFPNLKRFRPDQPSNYNGHRLPLQAGSFLLNDDCQPISNDLKWFLDVMDMAAECNDLDELHQSFATAKEYIFKSNFSSSGEPLGQRGKVWKAHCELVIESGWSAAHQTNQILGTIAQYGRVFRGLSDQPLADFVLETALACPGYEQFCRHQRDIVQRCKDWASSAQKAYTPYRGEKRGNAWREQKERSPNLHNVAQSENAIARIKQAIAQCKNSVFSSIRDLVAALRAIAGCSISTLYKHRDLWKEILGCNAQNAAIEGNSDVKAIEADSDSESLEPLPCGLLHPNSYYEGVQPDQSLNLNPKLESAAVRNPASGSRTDRFPLKPP